MEKALSNITVLDLTRVLAGPYCTMMLADYGANVIKIEMPGKGDDTRAMGPKKNDYSMYYAYVNRGKKGITLNLKSEEGKKLFLEMVKKADVVVENYRPGVMDKLGVGYDVLKEVNDQIIYAAVSGFGCYGPKHQRPGYDIIAQATSGLMSITGEAGGQPLRVGNAMGDVLGGMNLTIGILMALNARTVTGRGQRVDVALVDSVVSSLEVGWQRFFASGKQPELIGNRYASAFPYDSFQASDGRFVIGCGNDKLFTLLCTKALDRPDLLEDPRFDTNIHRCENYAALKPEIEKWSSQHTIADCVAIIDAAGQLITPGYVDIHAHGAWEHSFDDGPEGIDIARAGHAVHGTTRQVLSLITNPIDVICANLKNVRAPTCSAPISKVRSWRSPARALMIPSASRTRFPSSSTSCWALPTAASARSPSRPSCLTASAPSSSSRRRASCRPSATATPITRPPRPVSTPARAS